MSQWIEGGALKVITTGNGHLLDSKATFPCLYYHLHTNPHSLLRDGYSFQDPSAISSKAALGIGYLCLGAKVVEEGNNIDAKFAVAGHGA